MRRHRPTALLAAIVALAVPATAGAAVHVSPSEVIDGPSPDILALGGVDLAGDGTGTVVYIRRDANVDHVFAADLRSGRWQPAQRVDAGVATAASTPVVSVGADGRTAIAFSSGGFIYTTVRGAGSPAYTPAQAIGAGATPSIDMGINGTAYVAFASGADVRVAYLDRTSVSFALLPTVMDANPAQPAGDNAARRPRVAAAADGTGIVVWGEQAIPGSQHVYARRLLRSNAAQSFTDLNAPSVGGHPTGDADSPDVDIEFDSSYAWIVFRQAVDGVPRALARRLVGSALTDAAVIDAQGFPAGEGTSAPDVAINGTGGGLAADGRAGSHQVMAAPIVDDSFDIGAGRMDSAPANVLDPSPLVAASQNNDGYLAWQQSVSAADPAELHGRLFERGSFKGEALLTTPVLGPIDPAAGFDLSADRIDDVAVAAIQAGADGRRLVAAMIDQGPRAFSGITHVLPRTSRTLRWAAPLDLWGGVTYAVTIDGRVVGRTTGATSLALRKRPKAGTRRWRVVARDGRGTVRLSYPRRLVVEGKKR